MRRRQRFILLVKKGSLQGRFTFTPSFLLNPLRSDALLFIFIREVKGSFWFSTVILLTALPKSLHDQPYLTTSETFRNQLITTIARCNYILISHSLFLFSVHLLILHFSLFFLKNILYMLYCHVDLIIYYLYRGRAVTKFTNLQPDPFAIYFC